MLGAHDLTWPQHIGATEHSVPRRGSSHRVTYGEDRAQVVVYEQLSEQRWLRLQAANSGKLTAGVSLNGAMVSDISTNQEANGPPSAPVANGLLTARRVAALLGRTCRTPRNWERRGRLRPVRIGRGIFYRPRDVEALAARGAPCLPAEHVPGPSQPPACSGPEPMTGGMLLAFHCLTDTFFLQ